MTPPALRDATPAEIDDAIARLYHEAARAEGRVVHLSELIAKVQRPTAYAYRPEVIAAAEKAAAELPAAQAKVLELYELARPFEAEYTRRGGWSRYYLITDGHLHYDVSGSRCSRTPNSDHYWVTQLSGKSEADAIEAAGERICTICFPSAPVLALTRSSRLHTPTEYEREAARVEREKVRRGKVAKARAAAIRDVDGEDLLDRSGHRLATERAAVTEYRDVAADLVYYRDRCAHDRNRGAHQSREEHEATRQEMLTIYTLAEARLVAALAAKHGVSIEEEREAHAKAVAVRVRKDAKNAHEFRAQNPRLFAEG